MAQQGSIFSIAIDPQGVVDVLRRAGLPIEVTGPENDWRRITIRPRASSTEGTALVLRLKTRQTDGLYFRQQLPELAALVRRLGVKHPERQQALSRLVPRLGSCVGMSAAPRFSEHPDFLEAITLVARTVDGLFRVPAGLLDAASRPLLMEDGSHDPDANVPAVPGDDTDDAADLADDSVEPQLPADRRVAERMLVMLTCAYRGLVETDAVPEAEKPLRLAKLGEWFWSLEIGHEMEPFERHVLDQPLGAIPPEQASELVHSFDAVAVLAWGLRLTELPGHDCFVDPEHLTDTLGLFSEDSHFIIDSADLRDALDLRTQADRILAVHWRLREWELRPAALDFAKLTGDTWFGPIELTTLPMKAGDLAFSGLPIARAEPALVSRCTTSIVHRHRAINWLCGHHPVYSQVQTAT